MNFGARTQENIDLNRKMTECGLRMFETFKKHRSSESQLNYLQILIQIKDGGHQNFKFWT